MVDGLIKSPCKYFDVTPSADLNTRFSNDLGSMDDLLLDVFLSKCFFSWYLLFSPWSNKYYCDSVFVSL